MTKEEFIIECSQKILAAMVANPEKNHNSLTAIEYAEELWKDLVDSGYAIP